MEDYFGKEELEPERVSVKKLLDDFATYMYKHGKITGGFVCLPSAPHLQEYISASLFHSQHSTKTKLVMRYLHFCNCRIHHCRVIQRIWIVSKDE